MNARARAHKTVAAALTSGMRGWAEREGLGPEEFDRLTGFRPELARGPDARVDKAVHDRALALLARLPYPENVALGAAATFERLDPVLAAAWNNGRTAREAFGAFLAFRPLLGETDRVVWRQEGTLVVIEYAAEGPLEAAGRQAYAHFALARNIVARHAGAPCSPVRCELQGGAFVGADACHEEALGVTVGWEAPVNRLVLEARPLDVPSRSYNPHVERIVHEVLRGRLAHLRAARSLGARVEELAAALLSGGDGRGDLAGPGALALICEHLEMSRWTLRRQLAREGVSFEALWSRAKDLEAERLLRDGALSVAEIAARLGYSDSRAFSRFFRSRRGRSPSDVRHAAVPGGGS